MKQCIAPFAVPALCVDALAADEEAILRNENASALVAARRFGNDHAEPKREG